MQYIHFHCTTITNVQREAYLLCEQLYFCRDVTQALYDIPLLCFLFLQLVTLTALCPPLRLVTSVLHRSCRMIDLSTIFEYSCTVLFLCCVGQRATHLKREISLCNVLLMGSLG